MIAHLFKPRRRRNGKPVVSKTWHARIRLRAGQPVESVNLRVRDKQVAQQKLAALVLEAEREASGILGPKPLRDAAAKPVAGHLADYLADLEALGRATQYVYDVRLRLTRLIEAAAWTNLGDVTAESFVSWRASRPRDTRPSWKGRGPALSAKTLNDYLMLATGFLNWMQRHGRLAANPLAAVGKVEARGRETFKRRALTEAEALALVAHSGDRSLVYMTAMMTGLRRGELRQLRWDDVDLDAEPPRIMARAATTKNRKDATLFLRDDLAAALARVRPSPDATGRVFAKLPTMEQVRADLSAAGIASRDTSGRVVDLHAMRHTFATHLALGNVSPTVAMRMMRHSDPRLTMVRYTDAGQLPVAAALDVLPKYGPAKDAQNYAQPPVETGQDKLRRVATDRPTATVQTPRPTGVRRGESGHVVTRQDGSKEWAIQGSNL